VRQFCSVTGTVILIITAWSNSAIAEDCSATSSQLVASAASVSQFSLALGSGAFGSEPCSTHAPREAQAAQQLLIYDNQSPTEVIGSSETAVFYTRRSPTISAGAHRSRTPHGDLIVAAARDLAPGGRFALVDFHATRVRGFARWMGVNHVRMDGQLRPILRRTFTPAIDELSNAYGGVWEYLIYVGRR
jgi:hypothetical protein